ncbi:hypothetical protein P67b_00012 [Ruegeria phage Tedan]|nr:hypothetical protein P67b_00012 [Ruegeria phage Tedan]
MLKIVKTTKAKKATWLGKAGVVQLYHFDSKRTGKRVAIHYWIDQDVSTVKAVEGDAFRDPNNFKGGEEIEVPGNLLADLNACQTHALKAAEFFG